MSTFSCFLLAAFEAGGHRPQPLGLRTSESREAFRLGVKPGGVAQGASNDASGFYGFCQNLQLIQPTRIFIDYYKALSTKKEEERVLLLLFANLI